MANGLKVLVVTGYKPTELSIFSEEDERITYIKAAIAKRLTGFIEEGLEWVLLSGQMGIELWTAEVVFDLQADYDIKLGVIPPFENQQTRWPEALQQKYEELQLLADFFKPLYSGEYKGAYQFKARDKWLIDKSDGCLLLLHDEYPGSVKFFHEEAKHANKPYPIHLITPEDLDDIVEEIQMADPRYWE